MTTKPIIIILIMLFTKPFYTKADPEEHSKTTAASRRLVNPVNGEKFELSCNHKVRQTTENIFRNWH